MWRLASVSMVLLHSPSAPTATGTMPGSSARIASTTWRCFSTYLASGMWPSCQSPYISLPIAQSLIPKGAGLPLSARRRPSGVVAAPFAYWTSAADEEAPARPVFTAT